MKKIKVNWGLCKDFAELACGFAIYGLTVAASNKAVQYVTNEGISKIGYKEAVGAIMNSSMYSHDKRDAVSVLKRDEDAEYYGAIIHIMKDSYLYSHDKVKMIKDLSQN